MRAISASYVPKSYADLLRRVQQALFVGQREIDEAWVRTYHETGRLIVAHVLLHQRADYGAHVFGRLARDTAASERKLYECAQFYRAFPILRHGAKLGWAHYRVLCQVENEVQRLALLKDTLKEGWTSPELISRVRAINATHHDREVGSNGNGSPDKASAVVEPKLLLPRRGTPGLHPIVDRGDGPVVDLGFKLYRALGNASKLTTADIVRLTEDGARRVEGAIRAELFTYGATIRRIVDGDTMLVALEIAPGITLEKLLRLRGLDCPDGARQREDGQRAALARSVSGGCEPAGAPAGRRLAQTSTAARRAAKGFVEEFAGVGNEVVLSTTKPDKYDRSLADVFITKPRAIAQRSATDDRVAADGGVFLNNMLLQNGHAVRYDGGPKDA